MPITLLFLTAFSMLVSLILWRLLNAQNNKAQVAYAKHRKEHYDLLNRAKNKRRELKLVLNAIDDPLLIIDQHQRIKIANIAAKKLCANRSLKGKSLNDAFLDKTVLDAIGAADFTPDSPATRNKHIFPANTFRIPQESAWIIDTAPLKFNDSDSSRTLYRIILRDITTEHLTDQIKREFVANASHELRTPLAIISGYLENLIEDDIVDDPATARKFLITMRKHSDRLSQMIEEMLTISKLENKDSTQINRENFSLNQLVNNIIERLSPIIEQQSAQVTLSFSPAEITLHGDPFYWQQALTNLIENALKQNTDIAVNITIDAQQAPHATIIKVIDNGKGIPAAHLPYIFNRFYRVEKHHSQNELKGTGLGLAIVKHAIEAHNGTVTATSSPGIETTFTITV